MERLAAHNRLKASGIEGGTKVTRMRFHYVFDALTTHLPPGEFEVGYVPDEFIQKQGVCIRTSQPVLPNRIVMVPNRQSSLDRARGELRMHLHKCGEAIIGHEGRDVPPVFADLLQAARVDYVIYFVIE